MTADPRLTVSYLLSHPPTDLGAVTDVIERIRQKAIELGFRHVSDLVCLTTEEDILDSRYGGQPIRPHAVVYFGGALFDSDPAEFGLCSLPVEIEIGGAKMPYAVADWTWSAGVRTRDLKAISELFDFAAGLGLWTSMTFAGMTVSSFRGATGAVEYEQEWLQTPEDC
jgi:hypothetical protein